MRLIDADKLRIIPYSAFDVMPVCDISSAPTVDAIPVDWLRERASRMLDFGEGIERIIKEWQDEQSK